MKEAQTHDKKVLEICARIKNGLDDQEWLMDSNEKILLSGKLYVPKAYRQEVLKEFHCSRFAVHPRSSKIYKDLQRQYRWPRMKKDVAEYVAKYLTCQQIKFEHLQPE